ncbi:MAG TPA: acyltransferase family protein [Candidatus Udaeobacter sp.]
MKRGAVRQADTASLGYRADVDGLRAVAILAVLGFHAFPHSVPGGFVGVDIFFVISGFLISRIIFNGLAAGNFSFLEFYARRIRRIFPALIVVLTASYVIGSRTMLSGAFMQLGKHIAAAGVFVLNFVLWKESGYFDTDALAKPLLHLWSLAVEEQFYLVWPLLALLAWKRKFSIGLCLALIVVLSFSYNVVTANSSAVAAFYSPVSRFWQLLAGGALAYSELRSGTAAFTRINVNAPAFAGALLILGSVFFFNSHLAYPGWYALAPTIGAVLMIGAGKSAWVNANILSSRPFVWIGLISYPLYLWHWPLLSFAYIDAGQTPPAWLRSAILVASFVLAYLTYILFELPIRGAPRFGSAKVAALCGFVAILVLFGGNIYLKNGEVTSYQRAFNIHYVELAQEWRGGKCLIGPDSGWPVSPDAGLKNFDGCVEDGSQPLLVLWGDSFAAHLYPGIKHEQSDYVYRIGQFTFNACPPLTTFDYPGRAYCREYSAKTLDHIVALKPQVLVIAAAWTGPHLAGHLGSVLPQLRAIVERMPSTKIVVVGSPPIWREWIPKLMQRLSVVRDGKLVSVPDVRLAGLLDSAGEERRHYFESLVAQVSVTYFAAYDVLCNSEGCLTREGRDFQNLFSMDGGHLTVTPSIMVGKALMRSIYDGKTLRKPAQ